MVVEVVVVVVVVEVVVVEKRHFWFRRLNLVRRYIFRYYCDIILLRYL